MNAFVSVALAAAVSAVAWRARALNPTGAVAATVVGGAVLAFGGLSWALTLVAFFVVASALSRFRRAAKDERLGGLGTIADPRGRNARQVLANGGWAVLAALGAAWAPGRLWPPVFFGSLAAAAADTWATELGVLSGRLPRSVRTWQRVPPGTSGGVTWLGTAAAAGGAAFVAAVGYALGDLRAAEVAAVAFAGAAGALVDSALGATAQARFQCLGCGFSVESREHPSCAGRAVRTSGLPFVDNDIVNLLGSGAGAGVALALW